MINSGEKRLGMPLWSYGPNQAKEIYIPTDKPTYALVALDIQRPMVVFSCGIPVRIAFQPDQDYELVIRFDDNRNSCTLEASHIVLHDGAYERVPFARFDNRVKPESAACMKAFEKVRWF
jgi:hypothetical protein